jgi:hypothetical protein
VDLWIMALAAVEDEVDPWIPATAEARLGLRGQWRRGAATAAVAGGTGLGAGSG